MEKRYRYENKYILSPLQLRTLRLKISGVCFSDRNVDEFGRYQIRSVYFDDCFDSAMKANAIGIEPRYKWRIRMYNNDSGYINLEKKNKIEGKVYKESTTISKDLCSKILSNINDITFPTANPLLNVFMTDVFNKLLTPKIIIQYDREPYVEQAGDVRITFDNNMCFSYDVGRFFDENIFMYPIMNEDINLLEVKYTDFLPEHLQDIIDDGTLSRTTFSKYYLSRKAGESFKNEHI